MDKRAHCGKCHTCGAGLVRVLDGEQWCPVCRQYRRYQSHGWSPKVGESGECPAPENAGVPPEILKAMMAYKDSFFGGNGRVQGPMAARERS